MGNNTSLDIMLQEALKRSMTSPTSPDAEGNGQDDSKPTNNLGNTEEIVPDNEIEIMMKLMDMLHRATGEELDSDSQAESNEVRAYGISARAELLVSLFKRTGSVDSIEKAIELRHRALSLTPEGHVDRAKRLDRLGVALRLRFEQLGDLTDVDKAIEYLTQAVVLTPDGHKYRSITLGNLGNSYFSRFERLGEVADIDKGIEYQNRAVLLVPDSDANKPAGLNNLGSGYAQRFQRFDEVANLDKAIECLTQAVLLIPRGHPDERSYLNNLGTTYEFRFERLGDVADVDKAIKYQTQAVLLTPDGHAAKPSLLETLGNSYLRRFERFGELEDVDKAIECQTQASLLTPDGHADKLRRLSNLGNPYLCRFERLGEVADVDKAIACLAQAVLLTPDGHAGKPAQLSTLGDSYARRFVRLGEVADVNKAVECQTKAVLLTPDGHAATPGLLNNLGNSYARRFDRLGEVADVDKAIECQTQAVQLTPDGHADKPVRFTNLGSSYRRRFERFGDVTDVDKAIEYQTQAILLTPDGHAVKPSLLNNLGNSYSCRFERLRDAADADKATECQTQAVLLIPDGHADKPISFENLGNAYMLRFRLHPLQHADLDSASTSFQSAAQQIVGNPSQQIRCARHWATCSSLLGISPWPAYERCMELIPRVIWLGTTISQRYESLATISDLAAEAAAWAISVQEYDLAIEWLEQGRSVVWSQVLQLRTPFDDLATTDPSLAESLTSIAAQLEGAGTRGSETASSNNTISHIEEDAQSHRRLAEEWERALSDARNIPGFESFMLPRKASELKRSATDGPIVLINTHSKRSDALIIIPECDDILHIPLANLSLERVAGFREELYYCSRHRGDSDRGFSRIKPAQVPEDPFKCMLADLWSIIVQPVLDALACTCQIPADELPHVTWCATGALAFLPLHAAGLYDGSSPNTYDLVVSSYTPTLSALLASKSTTLTSGVGILGVGQQYTRRLPPLPSTVRELEAIKNQAESTRYHQLDGQKATINAVLDAMNEHSWVHLACHASQNPSNPVQSAFHLQDGSLTLETITKRQFQDKGLAFLSACQTAAGDDNLPDEAVHLAAGMLMAGYPSVIATMWPMWDEDGPEVAERVYAELLKDGKMDHRGAARALHKAVAGLREKIGEDSFKRWVPFIHIGV